MRIAMVLDKNFPPDPRVEREAITLINTGHEVSLIAISTAQGAQNEKYKGINLIRIKIRHWVYLLSALAYSFPLYHWIIARKLKGLLTDYDAIHVHDMVIARSVFKVVNNRLPIVLDLHENRPAIMREYPRFKKFPQKWLVRFSLWEKAQRQLINKASKVIVVTELAKKDVVAEGKEGTDVFVVPNTIDPAKFERVPSPLAADLVYFGDTGFRRGTDTMILGMKSIAKQFPDSRLHIIGTSSDDAVLQDIISMNGLNEVVRMHGWQSEEFFIDITKKCCIGLSPLKRNIHHDTTYANKVFQYMSLGLAVIASDCQAQEELVEDCKCGLIHEASSVEDFVRKVAKLLSDSTLCREMGQNGREAVLRSWNWDATSHSLIELYDKF